MKRAILFALIILAALQGTAQKLPNWVNDKPTPTNDTYLYVVESGIGQTELEARNMAIAEVFRTTAMRIGQPFNSKEIFRALQNGRDYGVIAAQYDIPINKVCEYVDKTETPYRVYILCQVAKSGAIRPLFDDFNECYKGSYEPLYVDELSVYCDGKQLMDSDIRKLFANNNSKSYRHYDVACRFENASYSNAGLLGFGITGGVLMISGLMVMGFNDSGADVNSHNYNEEMKGFHIGVGMAVTGTVLYITGLCWKPMMRLLGKAEIRKAVNLYNKGKMYSQSSLEIEYGLTGNGVFLSFSF